MQKIFVFLLSCVIVCPALSDCVSTADITKCARLPTNIEAYTSSGNCTVNNGVLSDVFIDSEYGYSIPITGTVQCGGTSKPLQTSNYSINYPFSVRSDRVFYWPASTSKCDTECPGGWPATLNGGAITKLPDDVCPDGFYTVPYDISCGEGFVDTTDVPSCADDTSGDFCSTVNRLPCTSGLSVLRTGSGLSYQLWADKNTTPALHVRYNGTVCYINLEPGNAPNSINVKYGGVVYHTVN